MIDFTEAENQFRELQARVQRGEPLTEDQYQEELAKLMVQDDHGVFWSLEPGTGRWLFFNGTEWVPGTPPRPARPVEPAPVAAAPIQQAPVAPEVTEAPQAEPYAAAEAPAVEAESVPTYVRTTETREAVPAATAASGIPPRPVRGTFVAAAEGDRPWLPFAIGALVLMLCAVALFFGVRNATSLLPGAAVITPTETELAVVDVSPTAPEAAPTDTPQPSATAAPVRPTAGVVTATTTDNVRLRAGPGTKYGVLTTIASGTELTAVGRNSDNSWIQVQVPGKSDLGWVSADFVTIAGDVTSLPVVQSQPTAAPTKKAGTTKPTPTETPAG